MTEMSSGFVKLAVAFTALPVAFVMAFLIYDSFVVPSLSEFPSVPLWWWGICSVPIVATSLGLGFFVGSASESIRVAVAGTLGLVIAYHFVVGDQVSDTYGFLFIMRLATSSFFGILMLVLGSYALRHLCARS